MPVAFGIAITLPLSGPRIPETPDRLYYEAQKREIQGEGKTAARNEVLIKEVLKYPASSPFPLILTLAMGIVVIAGLVCLYRPWRHRGPFLSLVRAATVGGIITILISVNVTSLRLELVFIPAVATGAGLLLEHVLARHFTLQAHEPSAVPT